MAHTDIDSVDATKPNGRLGLVFEDQRTGELRQVIYADAHVVLVRDETNSTTMQSRDDFELSLGSRYQTRPDARPAVDGGPFEALRERLAELEREDGRKAEHKAEALHEALDLWTAGEVRTDETGDPSMEGTDDDESREVPFEDIEGIGPKTAGNLRTYGFVTEAEVRNATDEELLGVAGLGPESLSNLRAFLE